MAKMTGLYGKEKLGEGKQDVKLEKLKGGDVGGSEKSNKYWVSWTPACTLVC